jgi:glutamate N-acetyltransferase/amino-acid N-acetyltransferase
VTTAFEAGDGVTSPKGFTAGGTYAGIKTYGDDTLDLGILASERPATVAATFTRNRFTSASVIVDREWVQRGTSRGVVVNSGIANSSTGQRGIDDARHMAECAAAHVGAGADELLVCSTGVIGVYLPMDHIEQGIEAVELRADGGLDFARSILTTDTRPKQVAVRVGEYTVGGCAKGAGMIHPNMATMLAFVTTDAPVERALLDRTWREAVDTSCNVVAGDGDTSPSDTAVVFANGAAGGEPIDNGHPQATEFADALKAVTRHLAKELVRDAEGATRVMEIMVRGAASEQEARDLIRLLSTSYLVKSAINGADPNWGRIVSVLGRSDASFVEEDVRVALGGHVVFENQRPTGVDPVTLAYAMQADEVPIEIDLGAGDASATGWGCDLSAEYVRINADYTT